MRALLREFDKEADNILRAKTLTFKQNGQMLIEERSLSTGAGKECEAEVSVAEHWEDYPRFGEYLGICRLERTIQL